MAYSPPNSFSAGTAITAASLEGNQEALRLYLHEQVNSADFQTSQWIETRHLQPPVLEPFTGTQHGISGHLAGQSVEGTGLQLTFCTSYLTGQGRVGIEPDTWLVIPNTTFQVSIRRAYRGFFHWWMELEHGPDDVPAVTGENYAIKERLNYVAPFIGNPSGVDKTAAQEGQNHQGNGSVFWQTGTPIGAKIAYPGAAGYGQRDGCVSLTGAGVQTLTVGLCHYSQIDRVACVNWGIALEVFYI